MTILSPEIKTILIPVDGSVHARKAALVGAAIAAKFGARVVLLQYIATQYLARETLRIGRNPKDSIGTFWNG